MHSGTSPTYRPMLTMALGLLQHNKVVLIPRWAAPIVEPDREGKKKNMLTKKDTVIVGNSYVKFMLHDIKPSGSKGIHSE